jgi:predicted nuclease with TOPRIM domain
LTLELEHTYEKKRNEELQKENANLAAELNAVKNKLNDFCSNFESLKEIVTKLQGKL